MAGTTRPRVCSVWLGRAERAWIAGFAASHVTSAAGQLAHKAAWKARGGPGELFASFLPSFTGYAAAGVPIGVVPVEAGRMP